DTFTNFIEPQVATAAVEVLERAGFRVSIPHQQLCCGRPLYDQGMLDRARIRLGEIIAALGPGASRGIPIIGLEPSCILTFRDELRSFFPGDPTAEAIGTNSFMLDEFLACEAPGFTAPERKTRALLHGHCHQKAIAGLDSEIALLERTPGLNLEVLDAGCCGMAGAFGYDREHYQVSKAIGARSLFPAIQNKPDAVVIADGFSCRAQIHQFFPARRVMHLAEFLNKGSNDADQ